MATRLEDDKKTIDIESGPTLQIANRQILPAAPRHQAEAAHSIARLEAAGVAAPSLSRWRRAFSMGWLDPVG